MVERQRRAGVPHQVLSVVSTKDKNETWMWLLVAATKLNETNETNGAIPLIL